MRRMEFTTENPDTFTIGQELEVTEGVLPSSYYYVIEHALGMSGNFKNSERLKTRKGKVAEVKETPRFHVVVLEFEE